MTEAEWEACADPHQMLRAFRATLPRVACGGGYVLRTPERKMRLLAVALGRCLQWVYKHDWHRLALDVTEEVADAEHREDGYRATLRQLHDELGSPCHPDNPHLDQVVWSAAFPHEFWEATEALMVGCARALRTAWGNRTPPVPAQADILREVFGNPFRSITFDPAWRTSDVMLLATGIYGEKAFDRMPILADALQDAGCDADALLAHLRDANAAHVRGCWALDLVLGKE